MAKKTKKKRRSTVTPAETRVGQEGLATSQDQNVVEHVSKSPCSVDLTRDAKGQLKWSIKLYGEVDDMENVVAKALALDASIRSQEEARNGGEE